MKIRKIKSEISDYLIRFVLKPGSHQRKLLIYT